MQMWFRIFPFFSVIDLALLLPSLAVAVRRLHDINRTGWWLVMPYVVMILGRPYPLLIACIVFGATIFSITAQHTGTMSVVRRQ